VSCVFYVKKEILMVSLFRKINEIRFDLSEKKDLYLIVLLVLLLVTQLGQKMTFFDLTIVSVQ
jgi:hypothetical protein